MASKKKSGNRLKPNKKAATARKTKKAEEASKARAKSAPKMNARELAERAANGDTSALSALEKVVSGFERWRKVLADQRDENKACAELVGGREAALAHVIEEAKPVDSTASDWPIQKLRGVEVAWQDLQEAKAEATERRNAANDKVRKAGKALDRAMQDGAQLTLPHVPEDGAPASNDTASE